MKKVLVLLNFTLVFYFTSLANDLDKCWEKIVVNEYEEALELCDKYFKANPTSYDAYFTKAYILLNNDQMGKFSISNKSKIPFTPEAYPYYFAHWQSQTMLNSNNNLNTNLLKFVNKILDDPQANSTIKTCAQYSKALYYRQNSNIKQTIKDYSNINILKKFQLLGPFDNLSQSGFNKNYGALEHPEANYIFKSGEDADIKWFVPAIKDVDSWYFIGQYFDEEEAICYAQTFINSSVDQEVLLSFGGGGSFKIWLNDKLIYQNAKSVYVEYDSYTYKIKLNKGYNRLLIQDGFQKSNHYPVFAIRILNKDFTPCTSVEETDQLQSYKKDVSKTAVQEIPHFAITYFQEKIKKNPNSIVDKLHLLEVYIRLHEKDKSRHLIQELVEKYPKCSLLRLKKLIVLNQSENRTLHSQELELFKSEFPSNYFTEIFNLNKLINEGNFVDAESSVNELGKKYGKTESYYSKYLYIYLNSNKLKEYTQLLEEALRLYPEEVGFVISYYRLLKNGYKNFQAARLFLHKYLDNHNNYDINLELANDYFGAELPRQAIPILEKLIEFNPNQLLAYNSLISYYYTTKNFQTALDLNAKILSFAPYNAALWLDKGLILNDMNKKEEALTAINKANTYKRNYYKARNKLRELKNKPDIWKAFDQEDIYAIIRNRKPADNNSNSEYLYDIKNVVCHENGGSEYKVITAIAINNKEGLDQNKELSIPYNNNTQVLNIIKAETVKKSGNKVPAETSNNQIVFTNLEVGDVIHYEYKIENYYYGRLSDDYWENYIFNATVPVHQSRFQILLPQTKKLNYKFQNSDLSPSITKFDSSFQRYSWSLTDMSALKREPFMPVMRDIAKTLYISTIQDWKEISEWYKDISNAETQDNIEINEVYNSLFEKSKSYSDYDKAKTIYDYICKNITYSSVSFRQSGFIPQKPWTTISTKLGDCKDVSSLFIHLSRMAGLKSNFVLVNTKNITNHGICLPSIDFNHCIAKVSINNQDKYIELTNNFIPFEQLPADVEGANALIIPWKDENPNNIDLIKVPKNLGKTDIKKCYIEVRPDIKDLKINASYTYYGNLATEMRLEYQNLTGEKLSEKFQTKLNRDHQSPTKLEKIEFKEIENANTPLQFHYSYTALNEVVSLGSLKSFRIPYIDKIVSLESFPQDTRTQDIEYWQYENTDVYDTEVKLIPPPGKTFTEIPTQTTITFSNLEYQLSFSKQPDQSVLVKRLVHLDRSNIPASKYKEFKEFIEKIVTAESQHIGLK